MDEEKVLKITIDYETHVKYLKGEEAQKFMNTINDMCIILRKYEQNPFKDYKPNWKCEGYNI